MKFPGTWLILILLHGLFFAGLFGQSTPDKLNGFVLDATTKVGIPGVNIVNRSTGMGTITDATGKFSLTIESYPAKIIFIHISYFSDTVTIADSKIFNKMYAGKLAMIFLRTNVFQIKEVTVKATARKLFEKEPFAISDYQFLKDKIIAIGYRNYNEFKKEILVADLNGKVLWSKPEPDIRELYKDCLGEVYILEKKKVLQVRLRKDSIYLTNSCSINFFNDYVRPVEAVIDSANVFTKESPNKQYKNYFLIKTGAEEAEIFYHAGNTQKEREVGQLNRSITMQFRRVVLTNNPDELRAIYATAFDMAFQQYVGYKPLYTKLYQPGDSLLIFDFVKFSIFSFSKNGKPTGETLMSIVFDNDWKKRMHRDPVTGRYYLEFLHGQLTYLIEIDPKTGDEVRKIPIPGYKHIDHINITNNRIYFLHQPDFGDKGKKLYYFDF
ncbi:MAG: carboxypeptidase-like regulatory domain-containing protein [Bacteroidia bacterium]|nr:carboxypeptidase-like regulatory domain-containing protein [Bacteroidia bacterium]